MEHGVKDVSVILHQLTPEQKECILNLGEEWQSHGYSKVTADLLWATSSDLFPGRFDPLVDCRLHGVQGQGRIYQHRLLALGKDVKACLLNTS